MFGSEVLEVGIGLAFLFAFASLIATALRELIEARLKSRSKQLFKGIKELLGSQDAAELLYNHPLIGSLYRGPGFQGNTRPDLPSYIPTANFIAAVTDLLRHGKLRDLGAADNGNGQQPAPADAPGQGAAVAAQPAVPAQPVQPPAPNAAQPDPLAALIECANAIQDPKLKEGLLAILEAADGTLADAQAKLGQWFDGTMDRVSGWYKRNTHCLLFWIGLVAAIICNIDPIYVGRRLAEDKPLREAIVKSAETAENDGKARTFDELNADMRKIGFPVGWPPPQFCPKQGCAEDLTDSRPPPPVGQTIANSASDVLWQGWEAIRTQAARARANPGQTLAMMLGWFVTALAITLGAPFWFDLLNKMMVIRSTVKPREKSLEEGSEDRQPSQASTLEIKVAK